MCRIGRCRWGALLIILVAAPVVLAAPPDQPQAAGKSGEIRGVVNYCGPGGNNGIVVHLPGRSFQAKVGPAGDFVLNYVPPGTYNLAIEIPSRAPYSVTSVSTADNSITNLGAIVVCRDGDADSYTEASDCNDNNPGINPGASETCDGFDNNCDARVDEGCASCTDADHDGFFAQTGCLTAIDCTDTDDTIRPNAAELCNGRDDNCTGVADEGFDLTSNPAHCGACDHACSFVNAVSECVNSTCQLAACNAGFTNCNSDTGDGCEINTATSPDNCGGCGSVCPWGPFSTARCTGGSCSLLCDAGYSDCDFNPVTGCEKYTVTDPDNCGSCGRDCEAQYHMANISCASGQCQLSAGNCLPNWQNCDYNPSNGCETPACGQCGRPACAAPSAHMTGGCVLPQGICQYQCDWGWNNCIGSGQGGDGCETSNDDLCTPGVCTSRCLAINGQPSCANGRCYMNCDPGYFNCDGAGYNGCETLAEEMCTPGDCSTACVANHASSAACSGGACVLNCEAGWADCDGAGYNGCEASLSGHYNCGACGNVCVITNASGATCVSGACSFTCHSGFGDCDGLGSNGCETSLLTNSDCGACGVACASGQSCSSGRCL